MEAARRIPSIKKALFKIHCDLDTVARNSSWWKNYRDLSDIEVLVLLLEDRRFFEHRGVDWRSVLRELIKALMFKKHGGASTIDMQFVRTKTGFKERTLRRKFYEMVLAFFLQYRMNKLAILRSYLSIAYLGHGIRGTDQAAEMIFGKAISELDLRENAMIAAMMVYPYPKNPNSRWQGKMVARAEYGLKLFAKFAHGYKQRLE